MRPTTGRAGTQNNLPPQSDLIFEVTPSPMPDPAALREPAEGRSEQAIDFCRRLVRTPSLPGMEQDAAQLVINEMQALGYDDVQVDEAGNVVGLIKGGDGAVVMLNTHLDHVGAGNPDRWPVPPFSADIVDDEIWGRGTMDIKGPMACQVYAPAVLRDAGWVPPGDVYVTAVVMEEVGGVGSRLLADGLEVDICVIGEATGGTVARGHRGRVELEVVFTGLSAHASAPERGQNPHYAAARFLTLLETMEMRGSLDFGQATVAPTLYRTDQVSPNVIPGEAIVTLDWRMVPDEQSHIVLDRVDEMAQAAARTQSEIGNPVTAECQIVYRVWQTYTGMERSFPAVSPAFSTSADDPLIGAARDALSSAFDAAVPLTTWRFATDGGHFASVGVQTLGFGPGREELAHTFEERISLGEMRQGLLGYAALISRLGQLP
jgi:succinyl-diaminopimelate desuccinylase